MVCAREEIPSCCTCRINRTGLSIEGGLGKGVPTRCLVEEHPSVRVGIVAWGQVDFLSYLVATNHLWRFQRENIAILLSVQLMKRC